MMIAQQQHQPSKLIMMKGSSLFTCSSSDPDPLSVSPSVLTARLCQPTFDNCDVSTLLKLPLASLDCDEVEPEMPKPNHSAFQLFFREKKYKLSKFLYSNPKYRHKVSFTDMAKVLLAKWKGASECDRFYYTLLAHEDKQRYETEMEAYTLHMAQLEAEQTFLSKNEPLDLPACSLQSVFFDDEELQQAPPAMTPITPTNVMQEPYTSTTPWATPDNVVTCFPAEVEPVTPVLMQEPYPSTLATHTTKR